MMNRREFITLLGCAAAWPVAARAQQGRIRRVGILANWAENDSELSPNIVAFAQALQQLGWSEYRNLQLLRRFAGSSSDRYREFAAELIAHAPDVIVTAGGSITAAVQRASSAVPIVFVGAIDPVMSRASQGPAVTPPVLPPPNSESARSGWSCSRRSPHM